MARHHRARVESAGQDRPSTGCRVLRRHAIAVLMPRQRHRQRHWQGRAGRQKISATLASTGTRSIFLHPAEAVHGDLGRIHPDDVVLMLSQSGETEEVVRLLPSLVRLGVPVIAVTGRANSGLRGRPPWLCRSGLCKKPARLACAEHQHHRDAGHWRCAGPGTRRMHGFDHEDFARVHPAGALGRSCRASKSGCGH